MKIVKISAKKPEREIIAEAARVIKRGGLVIFPTETVYGLGAGAFNARAVAKIFKAKGRPENKPLIVHVAKKSSMDMLARAVPAVARRLMRKFWPGPLTLVFRAKRRLPISVTGQVMATSKLPSLEVRSSRSYTVAIRMPDHAVARALILAAGPIAAPSANFSGATPPRSITEIPKALLERVDLILDAGPTTVKIPSTVLDLTTPIPTILRQGAISSGQLQRAGL